MKITKMTLNSVADVVEGPSLGKTFFHSLTVECRSAIVLIFIERSIVYKTLILSLVNYSFSSMIMCFRQLAFVKANVLTCCGRSVCKKSKALCNKCTFGNQVFDGLW